MKRIQVAIKDEKHKKAKSILSKAGLTWQQWGEMQVDGILSESVDSFGVPVLTEMAVDRNEFMTKIQEKVTGSLREHAFVLLAKKNNQTEWVKHKENEIERLRLEMLDLFDLAITGKWNKQKAAIQAIEFYRDKLKTPVTKAVNQYERYYKTQPILLIEPSELVEFLDGILKMLPNN